MGAGRDHCQVVTCYVLRPAPPPPRLVNVLVYSYPFEFPNDPISTVLANFGDAGVCTGTRQIHMSVIKRSRPSSLLGNLSTRRFWSDGESLGKRVRKVSIRETREMLLLACDGKLTISDEAFLVLWEGCKNPYFPQSS